VKNICLSSELIKCGSRVVREHFNKTMQNLSKKSPTASLKKVGPGRWPRLPPLIFTPDSNNQSLKSCNDFMWFTTDLSWNGLFESLWSTIHEVSCCVEIDKGVFSWILKSRKWLRFLCIFITH